MKPHYNANGEICNCGFGLYSEPVEDGALTKEAGAKLDWIRDREDKFFQTEEGQLIFNTLEAMVNHPGGEKIDPLVPWLWREAKKKRIDRSGLDFAILSHLADWYESNSPTRRGVDIMQLTTDEVTKKVAEWDEELATQMAEAEAGSGRVVAELDDGWTIQQITTEEGAEQEGDAMGHCVGGYGRQIVSGSTLIYSLRDPKNQPHATIEIRPDHENNEEIIKQINKFQRVYNLVGTHRPALKALVKGGATNDQIRETIENLLKRHTDVDYKEFVAVLRANLEDKEGEYYDEKISDILTQMNPSNGRVIQIQGKSNREPIPEYQELIGNWLIGLEEPPEVDAQKTVAHYYAPENVWGLEDFALGQQEPHYEYKTVKVTPKSWEQYFGVIEDIGYEEDGYEDEIYPISDADWQSIVMDIFDSPDDMVEKAESFNNALNTGLYYGNLSPEDVTKGRNFAYDYVQKHFNQFEGNLPGGYRTLYESWKFSPYGQAADTAIGTDFIARNTDRPIHEYYGPTEPNPDQGELFGPGRDPSIEISPAEELPPVEPDVPWNDPRNLDNQAGKFGSRLRRWFKRRKANILDEIHAGLDPNIWDNAHNPRPTLKPEIGQWIEQKVADALARHGYTHMEEWMSLVITGSLTTYQYSHESDCDVSVFVNAEKFPDWSRAEMIGIMMQECDDLFVPGTGHPLQCYVVPEGFEYEDLYKPGLRSAYSLDDNRWIVPPEKDRSHDVTREMNEAYTIALENADKMEKLIRYEPLKAVQYYGQVQARRRRDQQHGKGDFAPSNISYKMMESRGLFDQIKSLKKQHQIK